MIMNGESKQVSRPITQGTGKSHEKASNAMRGTSEITPAATHLTVACTGINNKETGTEGHPSAETPRLLQDFQLSRNLTANWGKRISRKF